ncbi:hypothetical protein CTI12_AA070790 [Artemisia annua]|uniref:CCHC-type domain-containing protein n=1 Tax=Artemisia annua TaxID=35608 RepID=A0A2U1PDY7_ARTAN|nr:hypothetical protein CTI12_AA070790 [Artemisia annua]
MCGYIAGRAHQEDAFEKVNLSMRVECKNKNMCASTHHVIVDLLLLYVGCAASGSGTSGVGYAGSSGGRHACFKCGLHNHLGDQFPNETRIDLDCYNCHQHGHIGWVCPKSCCRCKFKGHEAVYGCPNTQCFN